MAKKHYIFYPEFEKYVFTTIIGTFLGILTLCVIIWNRLIRERLPRDLMDENISSFAYWNITFTCFCFLSVSILKLIILFREFYGIKKSRNKYLDIFREFAENNPVCKFVSAYIFGAPVFFVTYLYLYFCVSNRALTGFSYYLMHWVYLFGLKMTKLHVSSDYEDFLWRHRVTLIIFVYLPKLICYSILLYEVVVDKYIEDFYHYAVLLIIPYIFNLLRILSETASRIEYLYIEVETKPFLLDRNCPGFKDTLEEIVIPYEAFLKNSTIPENDFKLAVKMYWFNKNIYRVMKTFTLVRYSSICLFISTFLSLMLFFTFFFLGFNN